MDSQKEKKWYQKTGYLVSIGVAGLVILGIVNSGNNTSSSPQVEPATQQTSQTPLSGSSLPFLQTQQGTPTITSTPSQSNPFAPNGYYTNVDGNQVPSPYKASSVPVGATARCGDGTYSFSQHRQGTCSHHGGVEDWLN